MTVSAKHTLQQAASVANKTLTEFLLDSGLTAAFGTLADRRVSLYDATYIVLAQALQAQLMTRDLRVRVAATALNLLWEAAAG